MVARIDIRMSLSSSGCFLTRRNARTTEGFPKSSSNFIAPAHAIELHQELHLSSRRRPIFLVCPLCATAMRHQDRCMSRADIAFFLDESLRRRRTPTPVRPRRRYLVPPAVAENHQGGSNFRFSTNDFDCASHGALPPRDRTGLNMLTAMTAILIVLSIGILIAHALDAFRSR
jgi:hypothetical protein